MRPWIGAGSGLLISMLDLSNKTGDIDVKIMALFLKKNHLLRRWVFLTS